jgi:hypothetical protein
MRDFFIIMIPINMQIRKFIHNLKKLFYLNIILKDLPMFDIVRNKGSILAETTKESTIVFSSLGTNEILKSKKKPSIIS